MSQTKERPILFSGPMIRALLDGRKTVTRRALSARDLKEIDYAVRLGECHALPAEGDSMHPNDTSYYAELCRFGLPGDRLWVRETWLEDPEDDGTWAYTQYMGCKGSPLSDIPKRFQKPEHCIFRASWDGSALRWRPSIHMPRWASRILLEVTDVRVERLQDISDDQAKAEGMVYTDFGMQERPGKGSIDGGKTFHPLKPQQAPGWHAGDATHPDQCLDRARWAFANLWEKINGENSWDANPWVWVVEFKRVEPCA
ncbi:hypothetical protein LG197_17615 [Pseudomonas asiatica]|uniref:hypothetical protein n=1 Tax=Pseudomonas asiatica TaxID=2219225 RepID=UPI0018A8FFBC|nr:hypothetical protein [Pseudomonas asiatica]MBF8806959.1 hypothetical protein [Pseudomonas asiatica]WDM86435.1 hypothetical protein LG197_17615 [Pseudomonas asiatica]